MTERNTALYDAWLAVHIRRFDAHKGARPDNFYNGVITAQNVIQDLAPETNFGAGRVIDLTKNQQHIIPIVTETFTCARCGFVGAKIVSDDVAMAEMTETFPELPADAPHSVICDQCYDTFMVWYEINKAKLKGMWDR
jgi:hypothetical protein